MRNRYKNAHEDIIHSLVPLHNLNLAYFASQSRDGVIKIWKTIELLPVLEIFQEIPQAFFPTENMTEIQLDTAGSSESQTLLAVAQYGGRGVKVFKVDVMAKSSEKVLGIETEGVCTSVAQVTKSTLALSSNELIELWDLKTETLKGTLGGHEDVVFGLFPMKPSAGIFCSTANDKTIRIWKSNTKMCLKMIDTLQIGSVFSICEL